MHTCLQLIELYPFSTTVPNLFGLADWWKWWQRRWSSFMHMCATFTNAVSCARIHPPLPQPGSEWAVAQHWATDWGLGTPALADPLHLFQHGLWQIRSLFQRLLHSLLFSRRDDGEIWLAQTERHIHTLLAPQYKTHQTEKCVYNNHWCVLWTSFVH